MKISGKRQAAFTFFMEEPMQSTKLETNIQTLPLEAQTFIIQYQLYALLTKDHKNLYDTEVLTQEINKLREKLREKYEKLKWPTITLEELNYNTIKQKLQSQSDRMLQLACTSGHSLLRDNAIDSGAFVDKLLFEYISNLEELFQLGTEEKTAANEPQSFLKEFHYLKIKFLLESNAKIKMNENNFRLAANVGPKLLVLLLDHGHRHGDVFTLVMCNRFFKVSHLLTYMHSHEINILYERKYFQDVIRELYRSRLDMSDMEFYASIGDEEILQNELKNNFNQEQACWSLWNACLFQRENTVKLLINVADVNFSNGKILNEALSKKYPGIIQLLLSSKDINIGLKPENANKTLYDLAMESGSNIIIKLFKTKKAEIDKAIDMEIIKIKNIIIVLQSKAPYWMFGYGMGASGKAHGLQTALNNAELCRNYFYTVDQFLNHKLQNEKSINEIKNEHRIACWGTPTSAQNLLENNTSVTNKFM